MGGWFQLKPPSRNHRRQFEKILLLLFHVHGLPSELQPLASEYSVLNYGALGNFSVAGFEMVSLYVHLHKLLGRPHFKTLILMISGLSVDGRIKSSNPICERNQTAHIFDWFVKQSWLPASSSRCSQDMCPPTSSTTSFRLVGWRDDLWWVVKMICGGMSRCFVVGCQDVFYLVVKIVCGGLSRCSLVGCQDVLWLVLKIFCCERVEKAWPFPIMSLE